MKASYEMARNAIYDIRAARELLGMANVEFHNWWHAGCLEGNEMELIQALYVNAQTSTFTLLSMLEDLEHEELMDEE